MNHIDIIKSLGGAKKLSDELTKRGVPVAPVTVRSWTLSGRMIPAKYWAHIAKIGADAGVPVSFETLAQDAAA